MELLQIATECHTSEVTNGSPCGFASAVTVWINKPHVVNRRLCGAVFHCFAVIPISCLSVQKLVSILNETGYELFNDIPCLDGNAQKRQKIEGSHKSRLDEVSGLEDLEDVDTAVIVRELLPKQPDRHPSFSELIIYEKKTDAFTFIPIKKETSSEKDVSGIEITYTFCHKSAQNSSSVIELSVSSSDRGSDSMRKLSLTWIENLLLKKLARWCEQPQLNTSLTSITLLFLGEYNALYNELKNKHGLHFAKIWPENTDPQKFVFEDVAIATYLLLLWKQDRERKGIMKKQSFVDLGCGNGLLVHILASEGHPGYGLDVRRRNIWNLYGPTTVLKEQTVIPSNDSTFPDCDWLIGNHSDELTPWIPVMAARTSYNCCYFVLPCCHWDFDAKFSSYNQFVGGSKVDGQYRNYLNFVQSVGETCGFNVEEDVLRIPSTKRVCFVGRTRSYNQSEEVEVDEQRHQLITSRCRSTISTCSTNEHTDSNTVSNWAADFVPREKVEVVRNCVIIPQAIKDTVIHTVFQNVLNQSDSETKQRPDGKVWRKGGSLPVGEVAHLFDKDLLLSLKSECGGLQTLLKNYSHVFQVSGSKVQLRDFTLDNPFEGRRDRGKSGDRSEFFKTSLCWFHEHHPDGCPRQHDQCMYAHGLAELREKPKRGKSIT